MAATHSRRAHVRRRGRGGAQARRRLGSAAAHGRGGGRGRRGRVARRSSGRGARGGGPLGGEVLRAALGATTRRRSRGRGAVARSSRGGGAELSVGAALSSGRRRRGGSTAQKAKCWKRGRGEEIYGGAFVPGGATTRDKRPFCPGWWLHPEQKGFLGGPGKFPARGPPLVPGGSTTRDKRGFPSFPPNLMFVFVYFYCSFKIGFYLLIQLIKL